MNSKQKKISTERSVGRREFVRSIGVLAAGYGLCCGSAVNAQKKPPFSTSALNHMTLAVSDPSASVHWYQGLFGMPIAARQGNTAILTYDFVHRSHWEIFGYQYPPSIHNW